MIGSVLRIRYEIVYQIGEGPIFATYMARDRVAGREVTIRLLKPPFGSEQSFIDALAVNIRQTSNINHPGVERVDEIDEDAGKYFLVGPHSPGISLTERLHKLAPFSVPVSVGTAISILEGLDALHSANIVHGDVGSHNLVVGADGSTRLQLAGLWRAYSHSSTAGSVVLPSLSAYLAPEISAGGFPSTTSDVYSVGVLLYELLCGRLPYAAETPVAMAMKHATAPTPSIRTYCPSAPMVLDEIVKRAMQKDPTLRYKDAASMLSDLRILQDALRFGRSLTWPLRAEASVGGGVVGTTRGRQAPHEPPVQPVAPRMSAIRDEREPRKRKEYTGDVPQWIWGGIVVLGTVIATLVIAWFILNLRKPKLITVPSLTGRDVAEARQTLRGLGLEMREIDHQTSDTAPADTILRSDPEAGDKVRESGVVRVVVSTGSQKVEVPTLRGLTLDVAKTTLKNLSLDLAEQIDKVADNSPADTVVDQDPAPHQLVGKHAIIHIRVSNGIAPTGPPKVDNPPTDPNKTGTAEEVPTDDQSPTNEYSLSVKLTNILTPVLVKIDVEDADGVRTLLEEEHDVNDEVKVTTAARGSKVTFRLYYDGELKKTYVKDAPKAPRTPGRRKPTVKPPTQPLAPPDDTSPPGGQPDQQ